MMRHARVAVVALALPAQAAEVRDCETPLASAWNLARPYDEAIREFANGGIALLYLLQEEPACCGAHLMVVYEAANEPFTLCRIVTTDDGTGWASLDLPGATARYDPRTGLGVDVPARRYDGTDFVPVKVTVTVNRATGDVTAQD